MDELIQLQTLANSYQFYYIMWTRATERLNSVIETIHSMSRNHYKVYNSRPEGMIGDMSNITLRSVYKQW